MAVRYFVVSREELDRLIVTSADLAYSAGPYDLTDLEKAFTDAQMSCLARPVPEVILDLILHCKTLDTSEEDK